MVLQGVRIKSRATHKALHVRAEIKLGLGLAGLGFRVAKFRVKGLAFRVWELKCSGKKWDCRSHSGLDRRLAPKRHNKWSSGYP